MYYGNIKPIDIANGTGVRVSLFVSGCRNHCKGCFQPETWDFCYGKPYTNETEVEIIKALSPDYISGLSVLGGDPFEPENQRGLLPLLRKVKSTYPNKDVWVYTGYSLETLLSGRSHPCCPETLEMLSYIDTLVDGRFEEKLKDISLQFRGSSNQRIINLKELMI